MLKNKNLYFFIIGYLILYALHLKFSLNGPDDIYFSSIKTPFFEWIHSRYLTWSGRIFPDTMLYAMLGKYFFLWKILNPLFIFLMAFSIVRLLKKNVNYIDVFICLMILGYSGKNIISSSFFWTTGSIVYLWPITLGLVAMIPYSDRLFRNIQQISNRHFIISALLAFLAAISNEQLALCMCAFSILLHIVVYLDRKKQDPKLLIITFTILIGTGILILAPGNKVRWVEEVSNWFPGFDKLSLKDHIYIGLIWLFKKLFIELKYIIALLSIITFIVYYKDIDERKKWYFKIFAVLLCVVFSNIILGYPLGSDEIKHTHMEMLYNFDMIGQQKISDNILHIWKINGNFIVGIFPYVFWLFYGLLLCYLIIKRSKDKYFIFFCLAAAIAAPIVLFFSPTIYASGSRVLAVSTILLTIVLTKLVLDNRMFNTKLEIALLSCLPILNLLQLILLWLFHGYQILY